MRHAQHTRFSHVRPAMAVAAVLVATAACDGWDTTAAMRPTEAAAPRGVLETELTPGSAAHLSEEPGCAFTRSEYHGFVFEFPEKLVPPEIGPFPPRQIVDMWAPPWLLPFFQDLEDEIVWSCTPGLDEFPFLAGPEDTPLSDSGFALMQLPGENAPVAWYLTYPVSIGDFEGAVLALLLLSPHGPLPLDVATVTVYRCASPAEMEECAAEIDDGSP